MNILFAVTGLVPHPITQAMWCFHNQHHINFDQVIILTTMSGKTALDNGDSRRGFEPFFAPNGPLSRLIQEYSLPRPSIKTVTMKRADGSALTDVVTQEELEAAAFSILDEIRKASTSQDDRVFCIYSGGRRIMASYLVSALSLIAKSTHRLFYVRHSPQDADKDPTFYYKTRDGSTLTLPSGAIESSQVELKVEEVAFPRLGDKYSEVIANDRSYREVVEHVQSYLSQEPRPITYIDDEESSEPTIIGESPAIRRVLDRLKRFAEAGLSPVLLCGETGTGKELMAKYYHFWHDKSAGRKTRLVVINCGAIPHELMESELFGARKGSHSTATSDQIGRLAAADGGMAFLDELGSTSSSFQAKLLRFLETGELQNLGGDDRGDRTAVRAKFVMALNEEAQDLVEKGLMREDFFYRIAKGKIDIPPLRDRKADIPSLVRHLVDKWTSAHHRPRIKLGPKLIDTLAKYDWPGNIRQLTQFIERQIVLLDEDTVDAFPEEPDVLSVRRRQSEASAGSILRTIVGPGYESSTFVQRQEAFEKWLLSAAYEHNNRNASLTASAIGLPVSTVKDKLRRHAIV